MKPSLIKIYTVSLALMGFFSCSKNSGSNTTSCNITYTEDGGLQYDGTVIYGANVVGSHGTKISSLSYTDVNGTTVVQNPTTPWTKSVDLKKGANVSITGIANTNNGDTIIVAALADATPGTVACP